MVASTPLSTLPIGKRRRPATPPPEGERVLKTGVVAGISRALGSGGRHQEQQVEIAARGRTPTEASPGGRHLPKVKI